MSITRNCLHSSISVDPENFLRSLQDGIQHRMCAMENFSNSAENEPFIKSNKLVAPIFAWQKNLLHSHRANLNAVWGEIGKVQNFLVLKANVFGRNGPYILLGISPLYFSRLQYIDFRFCTSLLCLQGKFALHMLSLVYLNRIYAIQLQKKTVKGTIRVWNITAKWQS